MTSITLNVRTDRLAPVAAQQPARRTVREELQADEESAAAIRAHQNIINANTVLDVTLFGLNFSKPTVAGSRIWGFSTTYSF